MIQLFAPDYHVHTIEEIHPERLSQIGIQLFILDIDNTLLKNDDCSIPEHVISYIQRVKDAGITPIVISNNMPKRVSQIATNLGIDYIAFALKPTKRGFHKAIHKYNVDPRYVVAAGDQIMTDILGANRMGITTILVDPLGNDNFSGRITRFIENIVIDQLEKKNLYRKGKYDETM